MFELLDLFSRRSAIVKSLYPSKFLVISGWRRFPDVWIAGAVLRLALPDSVRADRRSHLQEGRQGTRPQTAPHRCFCIPQVGRKTRNDKEYQVIWMIALDSQNLSS